jgi:cytochrome P450
MLDDPAVFYAGLRQYGPVVPILLDGQPAFLVIGYGACNRVLRDGLTFTRDLGQWSLLQEEGRLPVDWPLTPHVTPMPNMLYASGDEHARLRGAFKSALAKVGAHRRKAIITNTADRLIDAFVGDGHADIVGQYAAPLPVAVLAELFGFPPDEAEPLQRVVLTLLAGGEDALSADAELTALIDAHVARRRKEPRADIVTGLLEAGLTDEETRWTVWLTINAGVGATTAWLANCCDLLARREQTRTDLRGVLRDIRDVMAEVLWDHTPVQQVIGRVALADTDLGGTAVRRGDLLVVSPAGANLDPLFGDSTTRRARTAGNFSHLSWGSGSHECPAQPHAAGIVDIGVTRLWTRLDDIHLADPAQPTQWGPSPIVRMATRLDVAFDPARAHARAHTLAPTGDRR